MLELARLKGKIRHLEFLGRDSRLLFIWIFVGALFATALLSGCSAFAPARLSNDPENLFAAAEPATVMVYATVNARVSVPGMSLDEPKIDAGVSAAGIQPEEFWSLVKANPILYIDPDYSTPQSADASSAWFGSGFIADSSGYVVTNAHIAAKSDDEIKPALVDTCLKSLVTKEMQAGDQTRNGLGLTELSSTMDPNDVDALTKAFGQWAAHYATVTDLTRQCSVVMGANIEGTDVAPKLITADVVTAGEEIPGKDVAIVKIEGQNYPTVPVGDDTQINVGDKLYVIGYPAAAEGGVNQAISTKSITEPTFTSGVVSAKKQATQGYQVIQTDASVTHGNSGGPVLNSQGEVVGIATFGSVDPSTGQEVQGYNFIMPSTLIKQFLDRSGAHPAQGEFTKLYTQGLTEEASSWYKAATATFQQIEQLSPGNPYVQQHISQDTAAVDAGKDRSFNPLPMIGIGVVVLVIVGAGVAILVVAQRKKSAEPVPAQAGVASQEYAPSIGPKTVTPLPPSAAYPLPEPGPATPAAVVTPVAEEATVASEPGSDVITLLVITPSGTRQIVASLPAIIGQGADSQIIVDDSEASPHHAAIARVNGELEVTDLGGRNGIQVNEKPVAIAQLQRGDRIKLGQSEIILE